QRLWTVPRQRDPPPRPRQSVRRRRGANRGVQSACAGALRVARLRGDRTIDPLPPSGGTCPWSLERLEEMKGCSALQTVARLPGLLGARGLRRLDPSHPEALATVWGGSSLPDALSRRSCVARPRSQRVVGFGGPRPRIKESPASRAQTTKDQPSGT